MGFYSHCFLWNVPLFLQQCSVPLWRFFWAEKERRRLSSDRAAERAAERAADRAAERAAERAPLTGRHVEVYEEGVVGRRGEGNWLEGNWSPGHLWVQQDNSRGNGWHALLIVPLVAINYIIAEVMAAINGICIPLVYI